MRVTNMPHIIRCLNCSWSKKFTQSDLEGTDHTPRSKVARMQKRTADTCPFCGNERMAFRRKEP